MNRRNAMVTFVPANVMIAQNAMKVRMKNDLYLPVADSNLHCRCHHWKAEYEDMTNIQKFGQVFGWIPRTDEPLPDFWAKDKYIEPPDNGIPPIGIEDLLQHVGYSQEACGYEK